MPLISPLSWIVWVVAICFQPYLAYLIARKGMVARWPSLFSYLAFRSTTSVALFLILTLMPDTDQRAGYYFYGFWVCEAIAATLEVWLLTQVASSLAGRNTRVKAFVHSAVPAAALLMLVIGSYLSFQAPMPAYRQFITIVVDLDKAVSLGWLFLFLLVVLAADVFGLVWKPFPLMIALGLAIFGCGETVASWLFAILPAAWGHISDAKAIFYIATLCIWRMALSSPPLASEEPMPAGEIYRQLKIRLNLVERIRN